MTDDWVAAPEDAVAFFFASEVGHPISTVNVFEWGDDTMTVAIRWAEHAFELPDGDLTADVDWISRAGIGRRKIHIPSVLEALGLDESGLRDCDRRDCGEAADQFVLWSAVYWKRASEEVVKSIQVYCSRHVPASCPSHRGGITTGVSHPGFGWSP